MGGKRDPVADLEPDPLSRYADSLVFVARESDEQGDVDPTFKKALMARVAVGEDVPLEELRPALMSWLQEEGFSGWSEVEIRRRHIAAGATGVEATILISLLTGATGGVASVLTQKAWNFVAERLRARAINLEPLPGAAADIDDMAHAVASAWELRRSDLSLVRSDTDGDEKAATFEDRQGERYNVRASTDSFAMELEEQRL